MWFDNREEVAEGFVKKSRGSFAKGGKRNPVEIFRERGGDLGGLGPEGEAAFGEIGNGLIWNFCERSAGVESGEFVGEKFG